MAEITREQLELAALAAGHTVTSFEQVGVRGSLVAILGTNAAGYGINWRPHTDLGDAARLAVWLCMIVDMDTDRAWARTGRERVGGSTDHDGSEADKLRAWCEAVVLCAAAVGERMRKGGA